MDVHVPRTVPVSYEMVAKAYQKVNQGGKVTGVDRESWEDFAQAGVEKQLYVIWNSPVARELPSFSGSRDRDTEKEWKVAQAWSSNRT